MKSAKEMFEDLRYVYHIDKYANQYITSDELTSLACKTLLYSIYRDYSVVENRSKAITKQLEELGWLE